MRAGMLKKYPFIYLILIFTLSTKILIFGGEWSLDTYTHNISNHQERNQEDNECLKGICNHHSHFSVQKHYKSFFSASYFVLPKLVNIPSLLKHKREKKIADYRKWQIVKYTFTHSNRGPPHLKLS